MTHERDRAMLLRLFYIRTRYLPGTSQLEDNVSINDSGATSSAEAFFEVKTFTACPSRYKHNNATTNPAEHRATEIEKEYIRKFKNLDKKFAADVVGNGNNDIVGPFEASQGRF